MAARQAKAAAEKVKADKKAAKAAKDAKAAETKAERRARKLRRAQAKAAKLRKEAGFGPKLRNKATSTSAGQARAASQGQGCQAPARCGNRGRACSRPDFDLISKRRTLDRGGCVGRPPPGACRRPQLAQRTQRAAQGGAPGEAKRGPYD